MLVLITGASGGVGLETALRFAKDPANQVLAVSRGADRLKGHPPNIIPVRAEIATRAGRKEVEKEVVRTGMKLDILINNAGELLNKDFRDIGEEELDSVFRVNVYAPFLLTQILIPHMNRSGSHVVNIGSMGGVQGSAKFKGLCAYSASKGA